MGRELVPDPDFNDPAAWSFVGFGATVTGGQLEFINSVIASSDTVPTITPIVGLEYEYTIVVSGYTGGGLHRRIRFGGVDIHGTTQGDTGTGVFTGTVVPTTTQGLVFLTSLTGQWFISRISIQMSHVRTQLRTRAVAELSVLAPGTFVDVKSTRLSPLRPDASQLPYCNVYTDDEGSTPQTMSGPGGRKVERALNLVTEINQSGAEDTIDDAMDDLCLEIEKILGASTLNDLAHEVTLTSSIFDFDDEGDVSVGTATLTWLVRYYTTEGDPETAI